MIDFKNLRPTPTFPTYPPYHIGDYLEEYFYKFYLKNKKEFDATGFTLIPIFWTNIYNSGINRHLIQPYLNALPPGKYFTVSQHDDAVTETLPKGTLSFEAGGNKNGIPIPLICSSLEPKLCTSEVKDIFCSFVGSILPGSLRQRIFEKYHNKVNFYFSPQQWVHKVSNNRFMEFINITKRSTFSLCPRGYGAQSFRIYEVMQLNSIPVIVYDKDWFPFKDDIDWSSFSVLIHEKDIDSIEKILYSYNNDAIQNMMLKGNEVYSKYFTLETTCTQILKTLQQHERNTL